jgi:RHS repeat-associated protein
MYWYHFDALGSVVALSQYNSGNGYASIVEQYTYSAFGQTTVRDGGGTPWSPNKSLYGNPYMFTGRQWDGETGLYYYRARMYSPAFGRFLQPDPIGYADGMNMYAYVHNNPTNHIDPYGLADILARPVDSRIGRWLANWAYGKGDPTGEHWQIYYNDNTNSGYFGDSKSGPVFRPDLPGRAEKYHHKIFRNLDDNLMKQAEMLVQEQWRKEYQQGGRRYDHPYNDCHTYIFEVVQMALELQKQQNEKNSGDKCKK